MKALIMYKGLFAAASVLALGFTAAAQGNQPIPGDEDFLADAYAAAEEGTDFSYAGKWGSGKAYDGTDTSQMFKQVAQPTPTQAMQRTVQTTSVQRAPSTVRRVSAPVQQVAPQRYVTKQAPARVQTRPASAPPKPVVNTYRTVKQHVPQLRGARTPTRIVTRQVPTPTRQPVQTLRRSTSMTGTPLEGLPNANPGQCFARMKTPAQYEMVPKQVQSAAAYQRAKVQQAVFESDREAVKVKDGYTKYVVTQPQFKTTHEKLVVKPAYDRLEVVPARFSYVNETVRVSEPRLVWKRGVGLSGVSRIDPRTGDTWCLVEEAGDMKTLRKRVVAEPEQVRRVPVPAQIVSVPRQVLVAPAQVKQIEVPAQYRDFTVQRMVRAASANSYDVPSELSTVMTKVLKTPERFEWVPVLCDTNSGPQTIRSLQSALQSRGLYNGAIDGIMGPQTRKALVSFQRSAGIPHLGYLTTDTMSALGLR
jgi:hypothetical protein